MKRSSTQKMRTMTSIDVDKVIGSGTFGLVYRAIDTVSGERVAIKKIKMENEKDGFPITALREIRILKQLHHINIIGCRDLLMFDEEVDGAAMGSEYGFSHKDLFLMFQFCEFDLCGLLKSKSVTLTSHHIKSYTKQLLTGLEYIHSHSILHRDIKGANILVTRGNVLKIADWGLARAYSPDNAKMTNPVVTPWYRSPELLLGCRRYGPEIDIWSVGCLLAEMRSSDGSPLFPGTSNVNQLELIFQTCGSPTGPLLAKFEAYPNWQKMHIPRTHTNKFHSRFGGSYEGPALQLLSSLLHMDPAARISARAALQSSYFAVDPAPEPEHLMQFSAETALSLGENERIRDERKKQEEKRKAEQNSKGTAAKITATSSSSSSSSSSSMSLAVATIDSIKKSKMQRLK